MKQVQFQFVKIFKDVEQIRYRDENDKLKYAYTMNGSGLAIDRVVAAILENYQNPDGSISIPKVLISYMNGLEKISKK